ncbi:MAG: helix-turn-helix domain-containing protein [Solirubrobacteraceae bacterium]
MDGIEPVEICARIKQLRERSPLTQEQFAEAISASVGSLNKYERNRVPWGKLGKIADLTHADIRWIVFGAAYDDPLGRIEQSLSDLWMLFGDMLAQPEGDDFGKKLASALSGKAARERVLARLAQSQDRDDKPNRRQGETVAK